MNVAQAAPPEPVSAEISSPLETTSPYTLERTAIVHFQSPDGEDYTAAVAWPEGEPPSGGWPILYVLDGEDNFAIAAVTARRLARAGKRSGVNQGIVAGIYAGPIGKRVRDYTPPVPGYSIPEGLPASGYEIGGGDKFLDLMKSRIMPAIARQWPVDEGRVSLLGHSFGGLIGLHAAHSRPDMFDRIIAISPSLWFGDNFLEKQAAANPGSVKASLLIASGSGESGAAEQIAAYTDLLAANGTSRSDKVMLLQGQSHGTTMLAAMGQAVTAAFRGAEDK